MVRFHCEKISTHGRNSRSGSQAGCRPPIRLMRTVLPARPARILSCLLLIGLLMVQMMWPGQSWAEAEVRAEGSRHTPGGIKRLCILVGANDGGPGRETLRYAVSDALALRRVFTSMGGIEAQDCVLQVNPEKDELLQAMEQMESMADAAAGSNERVEVIFYYSGHSDAEGLLLGGERLQYKTLRSRFDRIPADVHIAILDSCFSGAFTRLKGGSTQAPFMTETGYDMKGYAFLSSSSSDEASQESDRLRGSFFTHYLVAGLRGAADHNNDERVTLNELYQFAYSETLSRTEKTFAGPQHPNYSIQMSGTGDVVITQVRSGGAVLVLPEFISGRVSIRDSQARLVAEIRKERGRNTNLALDPESYTILFEDEQLLKQAKVDLGYAAERRLAQSDFTIVQYEYGRLRGGAAGAALGTHDMPGVESSSDGPGYRVVPFGFHAAPLKNYDDRVVHKTAIGLLGSYTTALDGISAGLGVGVVEENATWLMANALGNYVGGDADGFQLTFLLNYIEGNSGYIQLTSFGNYVRGDFEGIQSSGVGNIVAGGLQGIQGAGVFNYAGELDGIQAGVVNWAGTVQGMQVGLINIAGQMHGVPVGLINVSRNGGIELQGWTGGSTDFNTALVFRAGLLYTRFTAGTTASAGSSDARASYGLHIGLRIPMQRFYLDVDAGVDTLDLGRAGIYMEPTDRNTEDLLAPQGRAVLGFQLSKRISLFAGFGTSYPINIAAPEESDQFEPLFVAGTSFKIF
ncbi:MAG: caspase family protein [bacterium]